MLLQDCFVSDLQKVQAMHGTIYGTFMKIYFLTYYATDISSAIFPLILVPFSEPSGIGLIYFIMGS